MKARFLNRAAVIVVVVFVAAVPAFAEDAVLVTTLKQVASDTTQPVRVRTEAVRTLSALEAQEETLYVSLAADKTLDRELRRAAITATGVLTTTGDSVKAMLRTIAADKMDNDHVRASAIARIGEIDIDTAGARTALFTVLADSTDASLVRISVAKAIAADPGTGGISALISVLNASGDDAKVRMAIVDALKESTDAGFLTSIKNMISATAAVDEKDVCLAMFMLDDKQTALMLRCRAVMVGRDNLDNEDILNAIKAAAIDKNDNVTLRGSAVGALRSVASQSAVETLLTGLLADDEDLEDIRRCALNSLSENTSSASAAALIAVLSDSTASLKMRIAAAGAIAKHLPGVKPVGFGSMASASAWQDTAAPANAIVAIISGTSEDPKLRRFVVSRLKGVTEASVLVALRSLAADKAEEEAIRLAVISSLQGDSGSVSALQAIAADETDSDAIRQAADRAATAG